MYLWNGRVRFSILAIRRNGRRAVGGLGLLAAWAAGFGFAEARPAQGQPVSVVQGTVVNAEGGAALAGAVVTLERIGLSTTTGSDGTFVIDEVPPGDYDLTATREGFAPLSSRVEVAPGLPVRLDLRLSAAAFEERVVVTGMRGELGLAERTDTGSRLGLNAMDVPASIDVIGSAVMEARGHQRISDAVETTPGVVAGQNPAAPSSFSMRGFTRSQITVLRDGIWLGPANMVMRPQNTFNLERVEVLRGPSTVLNGQGAVAGAVNAVTKRAVPAAAHQWNGLFSYGRFNTRQAAIGVNGPVSESLWYRLDFSNHGSDGHVERMSPSSSNLTGSLLWRPAPRAELTFSFDLLDDDVGSYFGTPLLPVDVVVEPLDVITTTTGEGIDARTRFLNYNVGDAVNDSRQLLLRADADVRLSDSVTFRNTTYGFGADRDWQNGDGFAYCAAVFDVCRRVGEVQRYYGYFWLDHDQRLVGNRTFLDIRTPTAGGENRATIGFEASNFDFERTRGFRLGVPQVPGDGVDLLNPVPGVYGPRELRGIAPTYIDSRALFVEDSLALTSRFRVTGALRYEAMDLERVNLNAAREVEGGGFERAFRWWSWRAGAVVNLHADVVAYGQYSNAKDPVDANIFLVNANRDFDLTDARQWEIGLKADLAGGRTQLTAAWFDVERDDVLEQFARDSATTIGGIASRGLELAAAASPSDAARLGANVAWTDAVFEPSANFVQFAGNTPPNVPNVTANLWGSYQNTGGVPIEIGGAVRVVGDRQANNANTIVMNGYTLADAWVAWVRDRVRVTFTVDNLTDTAYASWSDVFYLGQTDPSFFYSNNLMLGLPRTYSLMLQTSF